MTEHISFYSALKGSRPLAFLQTRDREAAAIAHLPDTL